MDENGVKQIHDADARRVIHQHIAQCTEAATAVERRLCSIDQRLEVAVGQREAAQRELRKYLIGLVMLVLSSIGWVLSHGPIYVSTERFAELSAKFDDRTQRRDGEMNSIKDRLREAEMRIQQIQANKLP